MPVAAIGALFSILSWRCHSAFIPPIPVRLAVTVPGSLLLGSVRHSVLLPARPAVFVLPAVIASCAAELPWIRAAGYRRCIIMP
jgi:hypothetical protein